MKYRICAAALFAGLLITACGKNNTNVEAAMTQIENLEYADAIATLDSAEAAGENIRVIERARGLASMGLADYEGAIGHFKNALLSSDGSVKDFEYDTSFYLGAAEYKCADYEAAVDTYSAILGMQNDNADAYYLRGTTYLALGMHDEALRDFNSAIDIDTKNPDLYIKIYESLDDAGFKDDGMDYLARAQGLDVKLSDYQKGMLYYCSEDYENARTFLEKARLDGAESSVLYLGRTYEALGDLNYAASLYKTYLEKNPGDSSICNQLGLCLLNFGDYEGALSAFEDGIASGGNAYQALRFNEIVTYEYMSDFKKAAVLMQGYIADYPDDAKALREYEFLKTR